jgi:hypothetical protein
MCGEKPDFGAKTAYFETIGPPDLALPGGLWEEVSTYYEPSQNWSLDKFFSGPL